MKGPVTIYRGTSGLGQAAAAKGLSWSTSYNVACWFACRWLGLRTDPLVVQATVDASDLIYWSNGRNEQEVIPRRRPGANICGDLDEWVRIAEQLRRRRTANERRRLSSLRRSLCRGSEITTEEAKSNVTGPAAAV